MIFDDNILKFMDCGKTLEADLPDLIRLGFSEMRGAKAKIWSGSDSPNPAHWSADVDIGMGLVCLNLLSSGSCLMGRQVLVLSIFCSSWTNSVRSCFWPPPFFPGQFYYLQDLICLPGTVHALVWLQLTKSLGIRAMAK